MMKTKICAIVAAVAALMMVGCAGGPKTYTVKGTITGYEGRVALANEVTGEVYVTAPVAEDGSFEIRLESETPMLTVLVVGGQNVMPIFLESTDPVVVVGSADQLGFLKATGTPSNNAFDDYISAYNALVKELEGAQSQHDYYEFQENAMTLLNDSYEQNKTNLWGAYLLVMGRHSSMSNTEVLEAIEAFPRKFQSLPELVELTETVKAMMRTDIGQPYTEITMVDYNGRMIKLSDVVKKSRYVLIDFWASWCNPCMKEMPYLKDAYAKYHPMGFEIYAVNLDDGRQPWVEAIQKADGMPWKHVGTQSGWECNATTNYNVKSIPTNYLIDCKTGLIIDHNLRGTEVEEALAKLYTE